MKAFEYVAADAGGKLIDGTAWASSEADLDGDLESRGLILTRAKVVADEKRARPIRIKRDDLISLTSQLATITGAGVPILEGLHGIEQRTDSKKSQQLLREMGSGLRAGESLSKVMGCYPRSFPEVYRASVRAGEASGALDTVLNRMGGHLEWMRAIRATTIQALIYPVLLCGAIGVLILILLYFVLPRIIGMFPGGRADLPAETRFVLALSDFMSANVVALGVGAGLAAAGVITGLRTERGRVLFDRAILAVPRLGRVAAQIATTKFACTASILHSAGCDVFTVLEISSSTCGNAAMTQAFRQVTERVRRGDTISDAMGKTPLMDGLLIQMVSVGERTGQLDQCLERLVSHYDQEVPRSVKRFLSLLEPALLVGAGGVVAFILLAALLPVFDLYDSMG